MSYSLVRVHTHTLSLCLSVGLEERLRAQSNSSTSKPISTRATTSTVKSNRHTFKDEKVETHTDKNGICYRIGGEIRTNNPRQCDDCARILCSDHVYLETNKQSEPYSIASILDFRLVRENKRTINIDR
jgi:hypothetical protein